MYHLIVYTIKPDVNAKLLLRSITYICDPVHLYCIASITEEASATFGPLPLPSQHQCDTRERVARPRLPVQHPGGDPHPAHREEHRHLQPAGGGHRHLSRTLHHELTASLAMAETNS